MAEYDTEGLMKMANYDSEACGSPESGGSDAGWDPNQLEGTPLKCFELAESGKKKVEEKKAAEEARKKARAKAKRTARKKNPQTKVKMFFKSAVNEQGFALKQCVYEKSIKKQVFKPVGYGVLSKGIPGRKVYCEMCMLTPCVMVEHDLDIADTQDEWKTYPGCTQRARVVGMIGNKLLGYFGKDYMNRTGTASCVHKYVKEMETIWETSSDEEEDDVGLLVLQCNRKSEDVGEDDESKKE